MRHITSWCFNYQYIFKSNEEKFIDIIKDVGNRGAYILQRDLDEFETNLANYIGVEHALGVANGTDAIWLALLAANIGEGDEVIFASHTYIATANAIKFVGAVPVPADCRSDHMIDPESVKSLITNKTKVILPTQLNGRCCEMDSLTKIAEDNDLIIIEDAAQGLGAKYKGKGIGTFGKGATISFYPAKNLGSFGDGGIITMNDKQKYNKIKMLRNYGHDSKGVTIYNGKNSRLDTLKAIILNERLKYLKSENFKRIKIAKRYNLKLQNLPIRLPIISNDLSNVFHLYVIRVNKKIRDNLIKYLKKNKIIAGIHYKFPNFLHPAFKKKIIYKYLKNSKIIADEILSLPIYPELKISEQNKVIKTIKSFFDE